MKSLRENEGDGKDRVGLLRENLITYGQSIIPEVFDNACKFWGDSWKNVVESDAYKKDRPKKRGLPEKVVAEVGYLIDSAGRLNLKPHSKPLKWRIKPVDLKDIPEVVLFECCCGSSHYPGIGRSSEYILDRMEIPYIISDKQSCCGGFAYYADDLNLEEVVLIGARNQGLIEDNADVVVSVCASCFSSNSEVQNLLLNGENRSQINDILSTTGTEVNGDLNIAHIEELLCDNLDSLVEQIELNLSGLKVATHHGCHYRNFSSRLDKYEILDKIVNAIGAEVVDYELKDRCCGGGFEKSFVGGIGNVRKINQKKQQNIASNEADLVILDCPGCEMTFDRNCPELSKTQPLNLGYMHINEFLALAMGADPREVVGIQYHSVFPDSLLDKLGIE